MQSPIFNVTICQVLGVGIQGERTLECENCHVGPKSNIRALVKFGTGYLSVPIFGIY